MITEKVSPTGHLCYEVEFGMPSERYIKHMIDIAPTDINRNKIGYINKKIKL
jgi:hypothetical protein